MLNSALEYIEQGFSVFPCKAKSKTPATNHGFKDATTDRDQVIEWWTQHPEWNVAIATGDKSDGLIVIDLDMHGDTRAFDFIKRYEEECGALPKTWVSKTGSGGKHILYKGDTTVRNSSNSEIAIDVRATGGYIIAPPSIHPNETFYEWEQKEGDVATATPDVYLFLTAISKKKDNPKNFVLPNQISQGGRNEMMFKYCCSLQAKGVDDETMWEQMQKVNAEKCSPMLNDGELKKILGSVTTHYPKGTPSGDFVKNRQGYTDCLQNLVTILENDNRYAGRFYYDERAFRNKVILPLPWEDQGRGERMLSDVDYVQMRYDFEHITNPKDSSETLNLHCKEKNIVDAVCKVCFDHRRNPLVEYLDHLEWDGVPRIDKLLHFYLGVPLTSYSSQVIRLFVLGAVCRAYHPGTKFDYIPVLVGSQGIGKSEFVKRLCPKPEWYLDNLTTMEGDQAIEKLENKWIVEVAELANLRRDKIESVKAFITQTQDTYRPKYARNAENRPRGAVFMGTTNSTTFLTDPTGNRRWLPLECGKYKPVKSLWNGKETFYEFEQVWAEAVDIFKSQDFTLVLSESESETAEAIRSKFTSDDPRIGVIEQYLEQQIEEHKRHTPEFQAENELRVCTKQIAVEALQLQDDKAYRFNEIKAIVEMFPNWKYHQNKKQCGEYGQQRYFSPVPPPQPEDEDIYF